MSTPKTLRITPHLSHERVLRIVASSGYLNFCLKLFILRGWVDGVNFFVGQINLNAPIDAEGNYPLTLALCDRLSHVAETLVAAGLSFRSLKFAHAHAGARIKRAF